MERIRHVLIQQVRERNRIVASVKEGYDHEIPAGVLDRRCEGKTEKEERDEQDRVRRSIRRTIVEMHPGE